MFSLVSRRASIVNLIRSKTNVLSTRITTQSLNFSTKRVLTGKDKCPYQVLGVDKESNPKYKDVKRTFLKLAMSHHPDTADKSQFDQDFDHAEAFHQIRTAFEMLMACPENGTAILIPHEQDESDALWQSNDEFDSWFKEETGHSAPFMFEMDVETMREVAEMTENNEGGGLDRYVFLYSI